MTFDHFRLAATNIEENVVKSYLVHESNSLVSMTEFALRLQISIDDRATADLFRIFDTVRAIGWLVSGIESVSNLRMSFSLQKGCGSADFREYLLCALYLIKCHQAPIDLIHVASKMFDDCGRGPRNLTRQSLHQLLRRTIGASLDDSMEIFARVDGSRNGFIVIGMNIEHIILIKTIQIAFSSPNRCTSEFLPK